MINNTHSLVLGVPHSNEESGEEPKSATALVSSAHTALSYVFPCPFPVAIWSLLVLPTTWDERCTTPWAFLGRRSEDWASSGRTTVNQGLPYLNKNCGKRGKIIVPAKRYTKKTQQRYSYIFLCVCVSVIGMIGHETEPYAGARVFSCMGYRRGIFRMCLKQIRVFN